MTTHIRLKSWLTAHEIKQAEMARRCEYDRSNFHRVISGSLKPNLSLAAAIERETSGVIKATDWVQAA